MNMIITLTCNRPQIKELATCIANQTLKPDIWYVINNHGDNPEQYIEHVKDKVRYEIVENDLSGSRHPVIDGWRKSFELFQNNDQVIQFDDDDYMPPNYFQERFEDLAEYDLTGCLERRYVRIDTMESKVFSRNDFVCTCSTAFTRCKDNFVRGITWCHEHGSNHNDASFSRGNPPTNRIFYNYKTIPVFLTRWGVGHPGTCKEHRRTDYVYSADRLREWFGADLPRYSSYSVDNRMIENV